MLNVKFERVELGSPPAACFVYGDLICFVHTVNNSSRKHLHAKALFVCVGVLRPSQQRGHVEPVS